MIKSSVDLKEEIIKTKSITNDREDASRHLRIAFLSQEDPTDRRTWSGITYYIYKQFSSANQVTWIHANDLSLFKRRLLSLWSRGANLLKWKFTNHYFLNSYFLCKKIQEKVSSEEYDLLVVGAGEVELIAYLKTDIPILSIGDTTFQNMVDYYPWHTGLCKLAKSQGNNIERNAIKKAKFLVYSSSWAADSAVNYYGAKPDKVSVVEFGANMQSIPSPQDIVDKKPGSKCNLLFLGVNWERKGGIIAYNTFLELLKKNIDCTLTIIGCKPELPAHPNLSIIPFLDKNRQADLEKLYTIFIQTDFLILPTKADCTPIVFSEAAAFGIPTLTTNVGGISSIIKQGLNGFCFSVNDDEKKYAFTVEQLWQKPENLRELYRLSRSEFENRLNWDVWMEKIKQIIHGVKRLN